MSYVADPISSIVSRSLPLSSTATLVASPAMSLTPGCSIVLIRGKHETLNRLAGDESIHNLGDVCDRDAPVKKVIRFD